MPKLVLFEGIPGAGKSTAAFKAQKLLDREGIPNRLYPEGDWDHPADFEAVACLPRAAYEGLLARFPACRELLERHVVIKTRDDGQDGDYFLSYIKLKRLHDEAVPDDLVAELAGYDIYDGLPLSEYRRLAPARWREFVARTRAEDTTVILECCFLQNPLTLFLARHNAGKEATVAYIKTLSDYVRPLDPLLIYLAPENVRGTLEQMAKERPKEWQNFVIAYLTQQGYGKAHSLSGYDGVIAFYEMRQALELETLPHLGLTTLVIKHNGDEWPRCEAEIAAFLKTHMDP